MRYVQARLKQYAQEHTYRIYVTDAMKAYMHLDQRYAEIFMPTETRTPEEIISGISAKLEQMGGGKDG